jgi:hypothetical protein
LAFLKYWFLIKNSDVASLMVQMVTQNQMQWRGTAVILLSNREWLRKSRAIMMINTTNIDHGRKILKDLMFVKPTMLWSGENM